jgi:MYXO-CTERM domain-containing protein
LVCAGSAKAGVIEFNGIFTEDSDPAHLAIGEAQFHMQLLDTAPNLASFVFDNTGPDNAVIAGVYFDGDILTGLSSIINGVGVLFSPGGNPIELPAAAQIGFMTDFHARADEPSAINGVNPSEMVEIQMSYAGSFADLEAAVMGGGLRIGLHGIGFGDLKEGSESFLNKGAPAPGTLALLAMAGLVGKRRRRR